MCLYTHILRGETETVTWGGGGNDRYAIYATYTICHQLYFIFALITFAAEEEEKIWCKFPQNFNFSGCIWSNPCWHPYVLLFKAYRIVLPPLLNGGSRSFGVCGASHLSHDISAHCANARGFIQKQCVVYICLTLDENMYACTVRLLFTCKTVIVYKFPVWFT